MDHLKMKFVLILIAVLTLGCSKQAPDPAQIRLDETALIQSTVVDPVRAAKMLALLDARDRLIEESSALLQQYRRELQALNADYDARREVIVEIIDVYNRERAIKQLRFIELIAEMKRATTAAEWKVIAEFELDNFNPRQLLSQAAEGS